MSKKRSTSKSKCGKSLPGSKPEGISRASEAPQNSSAYEAAFCVTAKDAAEFLGISTRQIGRYVKKGMRRTDEGWYPKDTLLLWASGKGAKEAAEDKERAKAIADSRVRDGSAIAGLREAKEELAKLDLAEKQGMTHNVAECERSSVRKVVELTRGLKTMRRTVESRVPAGCRAKVSRIMKEEIRRLQERFATEVQS